MKDDEGILTKDEIDEIIKKLMPQVEGEFFRNDPLKEFATKIWATGTWIFERNSELQTSKQKQDEEFLESEKACLEAYDNKSLKDTLQDLTEKQARIFWHFKGQPKNQTIEQEEDDYYNAKRYIGFLLAEMLLENCSELICANMLVRPEYVEYLQSITIEEYVKHKAYLSWEERNKNTFNKDFASHVSDYYLAMCFLDKTINNCRKKRCDENISFWVVFLGDIPKDGISNFISKISNAKLNSAIRIGKENNVKYEIVNFVEKYYGNYIGWVKEGKRRDVAIVEGILSTIYSKPHIINMLEYISKCPILCQVAREIDNNYREKSGKRVLETRKDSNKNLNEPPA